MIADHVDFIVLNVRRKSSISGIYFPLIRSIENSLILSIKFTVVVQCLSQSSYNHHLLSHRRIQPGTLCVHKNSYVIT